jgi:AcrR family transcriptional regulator
VREAEGAGVGGSAPSRRRRLPVEVRREQLVEVALREFSVRGYHETQMEHVAAAAGVSKGLLYYHFTSKEELYTAVSERVVSSFTDRLPAALRGAPTSSGRFRAVIGVLMDVAESQPEGWKLMVRHLWQADQSEAIRALRRQLGEAVFDVLVEQIRDGNPASARRRAMAYTRIVTGGLTTLINWWLTNPAVTRQEVEDAAADLLWFGLERLSQADLDTFG